MMVSGHCEPPATKVVLLLAPHVDSSFHAALRQHFRVLDFFAASGERSSLPAFLAAAPEPPRAAIVVGAVPTRVDAAFLDAVPSIRCIMSLPAGVDFIDLDECARRGVVVANSGTVFSADVADHAVGLLIDVLHRVSAAGRFVRGGLWPVQRDQYHLGSKLGGRRVGIVGMGNIGSLIAKRLEALGCTVSYNSRTPKDSVPYRYFPNVHDLAAATNVLVIACALNKATRHIVGKNVLEALGKDGIIVNISRGANFDEVELVRALKEGRIAGAGLDVFENEPGAPCEGLFGLRLGRLAWRVRQPQASDFSRLGTGSAAWQAAAWQASACEGSIQTRPELFSMDNVVVTPHLAAFTAESMSDLRDHTIANLEAFFSGQPALTPVHPHSPVK